LKGGNKRGWGPGFIQAIYGLIELQQQAGAIAGYPYEPKFSATAKIHGFRAKVVDRILVVRIGLTTGEKENQVDKGAYRSVPRH